jgi:hypothetical protein
VRVDDLVAGMAALAGSGAEPEVLAVRGDVVVVRVGDVVAKAHGRDTDPRLLSIRCRIAEDPRLASLVLPPLGPPSVVAGRLVTLWPYGSPVSQADADAAPWEECARLLARLHSLPARGPVAGTPDRIVRAIRELPHLRHADVVRQAFALLPPLDMAGTTLIHGDFHLGQLVHRGGWRLIDVDDLGVGDPAWDLGRPAALFAAGILPGDLWSRFLNAYLAAGGTGLTGDPWEALDVPARAYVVQMAARALAAAERDGKALDDAQVALLDACRRIVSAHAPMRHG